MKEKQAREEAERVAKENAAKLKAYEEDAARARKGEDIQKCIRVPVQDFIASTTGFIELLPSPKQPVKEGKRRCCWLAAYF